MLNEVILEKYKIQPVGDDMIDLICPPENVQDFIDYCDANEILIRGFTWWCHATDEHEPCGMGGPNSKYFDGWFSEIKIEGIIRFDTNEEYRRFFLKEWPESEEYKPCFWPGFWLE